MPEPKPHAEPANEKAASAFVDFVRMGDDRSLSKLAEQYRTRTEPVPTRQLSRLKIWSAKYNWVDRIEQFEDEQAEEELRQAARLDASSFRLFSQAINDRAKYATKEHAVDLVKMRESVRKPMPKSGASVNVNVSVEVRHLAEQMAKSLGISPEELIAEANEIAATEWEKVS